MTHCLDTMPAQESIEYSTVPTQKDSEHSTASTQKDSEHSTVPTQDSEHNTVPTHKSSELSGLISYYTDKATIHGISAMGGQPLYSCRRCIWCALVITMSGCLFTLMYNHFERYSARPFTTIVSAYVRDSLPFPAVTICNLNQFHRERVDPDDVRLQELVYRMSALKFLKKMFLQPLARLPGTTGDQLMRFAETAAHRLKNMFKFCVWKGRLVPCEQLFIRTLTDIGFCYTFNSLLGGKQLNATDSGHMGGLEVFLDIEQDAYYYSMFINPGIKVLLHEPNEFPLLSNNGFFVGPGTFTAVAVRREEIHRLPPPFKAFGGSACLDTKTEDFRSPLTRYQNYSYTKHACWQDCFMKRIVGNCGCRHFFQRGDEPLCSIDALEDCFLPHSEVVYQSSLSSTMVASKFARQQLINASIINNHSYARDNFIDLSIHYETLTVSEVCQQQEMTVMGILGDFGGHMGLCLGASILSLMELLEVCLLVFCQCALSFFSK